MLIFNEKTGFSVQEPQEVREEIAQSWVNAFKSDDTPDIKNPIKDKIITSIWNIITN